MKSQRVGSSRKSVPPGDGSRSSVSFETHSRQRSGSAQSRQSDFSEFFAMADRVSVMLDIDARVIFCNEHLLRLTGWNKDEVLGFEWFERFVPQPHAPCRDVFSDMLQDKPSVATYESDILTRSGERRHVRWKNMALRGAGGQVIATASVGDVVTPVPKVAARPSQATLERSVLARGKQRVATPSEVVAIANHLGDGREGSGLALVRLVAEHCAQLAEECGESVTGPGVAHHIRDLFKL